MYLRIRKIKKRDYATIEESFRDKDGKVKKRVVKTFGYIDKYKGTYDEAINYFNEYIKKAQKQKGKNKSKRNKNLSLNVSRYIKDKNVFDINISYLIFEWYMHKIFKIDEFYKKISKQCSTESIKKYFIFFIWATTLKTKLGSGVFGTNLENFKSVVPFLDQFDNCDILNNSTFITKNKRLLLNNQYKNYEHARKKYKSKLMFRFYINNTLQNIFENELYVRNTKDKILPNNFIQNIVDTDKNFIPLDITTRIVKDYKVIKNKKIVDKNLIFVGDGRFCNREFISNQIKENKKFVIICPTILLNDNVKNWVLDTSNYVQGERYIYKSLLANMHFSYKQKGKTTETKSKIKILSMRSEWLLHNFSLFNIDEVTEESIAKNIYIDIETDENFSLYDALKKWNVDKNTINKKENYNNLLDGFCTIITNDTDLKDKKMMNSIDHLYAYTVYYANSLFHFNSFDAASTVNNLTFYRANLAESIELSCLAKFIGHQILMIMLKDTNLNREYDLDDILTTFLSMDGKLLEDDLYLFSFRNKLTSRLSKLIADEFESKVISYKQIKKLHEEFSSDSDIED